MAAMRRGKASGACQFGILTRAEDGKWMGWCFCKVTRLMSRWLDDCLAVIVREMLWL